MNLGLILLVVGVPIVILAITSFLKYPFEEEGEDKKRARDDFCSDMGLDFFFIGLSVLISTTIARNGTNIPQVELITITLFGLCSSIVARLYTMPWYDKKVNGCLAAGLLLGLIPIVYSLYVLVL